MTRVLVTGAGGFLGREVVAAAMAGDMEVRAQVRGATDLPGSVEVVVADLRSDDLAPLVDGVGAVIHLAAAKGGDFHTQYASTVRGTDRLLDAVLAAGVPRFVLCSSFAVYDYEQPALGSVVDESAPLDVEGLGRDAYAQTKVLQEQVVRERLAGSPTSLVVLRPGVVHGDEPTWTYRVGEAFGRLWLALGSAAQVPLVHVADCARAMVLAATSPSMAGRTFDVLAADPPTQREYRLLLASRASPRPVVVPVPWRLARTAALLASAATERSSRPWRLPGFLVPSSLSVRAKPLRYDGSALRAAGWTPQHRWDEAPGSSRTGGGA